MTPLALHIAAVRAEGEVVPAIRGTIVDRSPHLGHVRPHHVGEVADIPVVILCFEENTNTETNHQIDIC